MWISQHSKPQFLKRVVIETANFDKGGLEKVILESAIALQSKGFDVVIITDGVLGEMAESAISEGVRVFRIISKLHLMAFLLRFKPSISLSHFSYFGYRIYKRLGIPNVTFIHNTYAFFSDEQKVQFERSDKYVSHYVSVSREAEKYAKQNYKISDKRITTIPNGLNIVREEKRSLQSHDFSWKKFGLSEDDFIFLNVASYNLHKGHFLMVQAIAEVSKMRTNAKIVCLGSPVYQPHFEILKEYVNELGMADKIVFLGQQSNLSWFYRNSDAFLLPSFIEGWSMAMNEAMFYQLPMILTEVGGAPEVIHGNDIGILISSFFKEYENYNVSDLNSLAYVPQPYDIQVELVQAMINMIDNASFWRKKSTISKERVESLYNFESTIDKYISVIESVTRK
jgi:glycosyltransferase involved in cell wall biosynthesis